MSTSSSATPGDHDTPAAVRVSRDYFEAWSSGDLDAALRLVSPDIDCHTPGGQLSGAEALGGFMGPFASSVTSTRLIGIHGDDEQTQLFYDTAVPGIDSAPGAEWHRVADGRITELWIVFDRLPFALARGDVAPTGAH